MSEKSLNEVFGSPEELRETLAGFLSVSFMPEFDGCPQEVVDAWCYWHGRLIRFAGAMDFEAALAAVGGAK